MVKQIFIGGDGTVTVGGTDITVDVRSISITGGNRDVQIIRTFGSGTNAYISEQPQELYETTLTYVVNDLNLAGYIMGGSDGSEPISYTGDQPRSILAKSIVYTFTDNTDSSGAQIKVTIGSVFGVSEEMKVSTTDHLESTMTFKCLPKDYKKDYTSNRVANPIV